MKLWLLRPATTRTTRKNSPWDPWYDKSFGFVIRAETEEKARAIADDNAGDENHDAKHPWLKSSQSICEELLLDGEEDLIMKDFASA